MLGTTRSIPVALATLLTTGLLAAGCGGGGDDGGDVASLDEGGSEGESAQSDQEAQEEELLDWVECMRDEGVEISDPTRDENGNLVIEGPGIQIATGGPDGRGMPDEQSVSSDDPTADQAPIDRGAMEAANEVCGPPPMVGGTISEEDRQAVEAAALEFAQCMRDEGIEDFPDPDFSNSGPGGEARTQSGGGGDGETNVAIGPFGEIDMDDPEVAAAFEECQHLMEAARPGDGERRPGASDEGSEGSDG